MSENKNLSGQIVEWLESRFIYHTRLKCEKIGMPGHLAIVRGQTIFIETKMHGENLIAEQFETHCKLRKNGAIVIVADDFNSFEREFSAIRAEIETKRKGEINLYD